MFGSTLGGKPARGTGIIPPPCAAAGDRDRDRASAASGGTRERRVGWGEGRPGVWAVREQTPVCALAAAFPGSVVNAGGPWQRIPRRRLSWAGSTGGSGGRAEDTGLL